VDAGYSDEDEPGPRGGGGGGLPAGHPDETREEREARRKRDEVCQLPQGTSRISVAGFRPEICQRF